MPKCRRRRRNENIWKTNVKKLQRNSGANAVFNNIDCGCRKQCMTKISEEDRLNCFISFWNLKDFSKQNTYVCGLVQKYPVRQRRKRDGSRPEKSVSNKFFLNIRNETINVCRIFFLKTFVISNGRMSRALDKEKKGRIGEDLRGKNNNKTSKDIVKEVKGHILSSAYTTQFK